MLRAFVAHNGNGEDGDDSHSRNTLLILFVISNEQRENGKKKIGMKPKLRNSFVWNGTFVALLFSISPIANWNECRDKNMNPKMHSIPTTATVAHTRDVSTDEHSTNQIMYWFVFLSLPMLDASLYSTARSVFSLRMTIMCHAQAASVYFHFFCLFMHSLSLCALSPNRPVSGSFPIFSDCNRVCFHFSFFFRIHCSHVSRARTFLSKSRCRFIYIVFFCIWHSASALALLLLLFSFLFRVIGFMAQTVVVVLQLRFWICIRRAHSVFEPVEL